MNDDFGMAGNLRSLLSDLGRTPDPTSPERQLVVELGTAADDGMSDAQLWLTWAVLRGELPTENELISFRRSGRLNGFATAISDLGGRAHSSIFGQTTEVEIVDDAVLVDVHHTSTTKMRSGVQRVVRETTSRWIAEHDLTFVTWSKDERSLRRLSAREEARMRGGDPEAVSTTELPRSVVVPRGGLMIIPELATDAGVAQRLLAMGRFSNTKIAYIGYDCVPLTSGETTDTPIAANFPLYLDAVSYGDKVAAISESTSHEFRSWKKMLPSSGRVGPDVRTVFLGGDTVTPSEADLAKTRSLLELTPGQPMILVVGSHEPRKNHLAVLQAAKILWEEGADFRLVMIGSSSWMNGAFDALAKLLEDNGRPLVVLSNASEEILASSYRLAALSVFTSFHEGFGLPIVESLRAGTPVIASQVGSMLEVAEHYGGVIPVDPHSDAQLVRTIRSALDEPRVLADKRAELAGNSYVSWDDYASEVWEYFVAQ